MQEKQIQISGLNVNYKIIGAGKTPVVLLHGWGVSSDKYIITAEEILELDSGYVFYIPDLPGFGKSEEPKEDWYLDDYVEFVNKFVEGVAQRNTGLEQVKDILKRCSCGADSTSALQNIKVVLVGHSFGGRVAIKYAAKYPADIDKLVLTGAAGIKHPLTAKQSFFYISAKAGKMIFSLPLVNSLKKNAQRFLYRHISDKDYGKASPRMRAAMRYALDEDLSGTLPLIKVPTVLIWGGGDNSTPLADGEFIHKEINDSKLFIIESANHGAPYNNAKEFAKLFVAD